MYEFVRSTSTRTEGMAHDVLGFGKDSKKTGCPAVICCSDFKIDIVRVYIGRTWAATVYRMRVFQYVLSSPASKFYSAATTAASVISVEKR